MASLRRASYTRPIPAGAVIVTHKGKPHARYGDDVRTEILGSLGAVFIEILPTGRARIGTADGVALMAGSEAADATAAGVVNQMQAFAAAVRGAVIDVPGAAASARATEVAHAVQRAVATGNAVEVPSTGEVAA